MKQGSASAPQNKDYSSSPIKVGIVDDHPAANTGCAVMLNEMPGIRVVLQAYSGLQLLELLKDSPELPDILMMDVEMKSLDGIDTTKRVTHLYPTIKIIALTAKKDNWTIAKMYKAGACAYLSKEISSPHLEQAILEVHRKGKYEADLYHIDPIRLRQYSKIIENLSFTENEIRFLHLLSEGNEYRKIADFMHVSIDSVNYYKSCIGRKLDTKSSATMVALAYEMGILKPGT